MSLATNLELQDHVEIIGHREGGYIDCWVPMGLIDNEEVPVKEDWARSLADNMKRAAERVGGTGQDTPITLGLLEGQTTLKIIDGFHRSAALKLRGELRVYATVKHTDLDGLFDDRIFTAKDHAHVRFSRVVQWIREIWGHTDLSEKMTVEQAVLLYRYDTDGSKLGLDSKDVTLAKAWVQKKEKQWNMQSMTIHSHLKIAEAVDPQLVHSTREKKDGKVLDAPTQSIIKIFSEHLPNDFPKQNLIMQVAMEHNLKGPEVTALCMAIKECPNIREAEATIGAIDWEVWEPVYGESKQRALRRAHDPRYKGALVLAVATKEVANVHDRIRQSKERKEEVDAAMKTKAREAFVAAMNLSEELGKLVTQLALLAGEKPPALIRPQTNEEKNAEEKKRAALRAHDMDLYKSPVMRDEEPTEPEAPPDLYDRRRGMALTPAPVSAVRSSSESLVPTSPREVVFRDKLTAFLIGDQETMPLIDSELEARWARRFLKGYDELGLDSLREEVAIVVDSVLG